MKTSADAHDNATNRRLLEVLLQAVIRDLERLTGAHVPIVAMTAHAMKGDGERCLAAGMDGYIAKPIRPEELASIVTRAARIGRPAVTGRGAALVSS